MLTVLVLLLIANSSTQKASYSDYIELSSFATQMTGSEILQDPTFAAVTKSFIQTIGVDPTFNPQLFVDKIPKPVGFETLLSTVIPTGRSICFRY